MTIIQKPFLSYDEQISLLEERGLKFSDKTLARRFLRHIGYSHLKSYWLSCNESRFEEIIKLYRFDAELKNLLLHIFMWIETSVRHSWIICLSDSKQNHNPLSYLEARFYKDSSKSEQYFQKTLADSRLNFIRKYQDNSSMPPIWKMAELLTFGGLSKTIGNLKYPEALAKCYDLEKRDFTLILQRLVSLRNICAHHHILWNHKEPKLTTKLTKSRRAALLKNSISLDRADKARLYNSLCFCFFLLKRISLCEDYARSCQRLKTIITYSKPNCATFKTMGFPEHWEALPLWQC